MVHFKKRMNGFGLTGVSLMALVAVSCVDSPDEKGSQIKEAEISEKTVSFALEAIPDGWNCPDYYYNDGMCDCGCGALDTDCNGDSSVNACEWFKCPSVNPTNNYLCNIPASWTCQDSFYSDDDCDCGCGAIDPTCNGNTGGDACDFFLCGSGADVYPNLNHLCQDQPIKIMPVGDSITAGEHYDAPAYEERTGYRKELWNLLNADGFNVDFIGTQTHGKPANGHNENYDWHSEAYPGKPIKTITDNLKNTSFKDDGLKPDILLVHVGTNGRKSGDIKGMLDMINKSKYPPSVVLLCRIIKRFGYGNDQATIDFNNAVEGIVWDVDNRERDRFQIIRVDMESGAGLDYSDDPNTGDMWGTKYPGVTKDEYHPNDRGNTKMANKFYNVLKSSVLTW